jgi:hypothetical protein
MNNRRRRGVADFSTLPSPEQKTGALMRFLFGEMTAHREVRPHASAPKLDLKSKLGRCAPPKS